jgi:hypothetical protein
MPKRVLMRYLVNLTMFGKWFQAVFSNEQQFKVYIFELQSMSDLPINILEQRTVND